MAAALVKKTTHAIALLILSFLTSLTYAGSSEGPYIIWVNLSSEKTTTDSVVQKFLDSGDTTCWNNSAVMFMRSKPKTLTEQIARQGLIEKNPSAQRKIQGILAKGFGDAEDGFDGIIVYVDRPKRSIFSLSRNSKRVEHDVEIKSVNQIPGALCNVMPHIKRTP